MVSTSSAATRSFHNGATGGGPGDGVVTAGSGACRSAGVTGGVSTRRMEPLGKGGARLPFADVTQRQREPGSPNSPARRPTISLSMNDDCDGFERIDGLVYVIIYYIPSHQPIRIHRHRRFNHKRTVPYRALQSCSLGSSLRCRRTLQTRRPNPNRHVGVGLQLRRTSPLSSASRASRPRCSCPRPRLEIRARLPIRISIRTHRRACVC